MKDIRIVDVRNIGFFKGAHMFFLECESIWFRRLSFILLLGNTLLFPMKLFGAEQSAQPVQQSDVMNSIDAERDYVSGRLISFAGSIDRFFANDRNFQETNQSVFQFDLTRAVGYGGGPGVALSGRAKLNLPVTEQRLHLLLETNPDLTVTGEQTPGLPSLLNRVVKPESYAVAARYEKSKESIWDFSTDAGIKFQSGLTPFARARGSYSVPMDRWRLKAVESVYWFNTIGVGETTQIDVERFISKPAFFRATSTATWLKDKQNVDVRQDFSIYHTLNERTALLYQASAIGVSNPQWQVTDYVVQLLYRYRLHRNWIFCEINPQLHFPIEKNFQSSPAISIRLEMLFDESK